MVILDAYFLAKLLKYSETEQKKRPGIPPERFLSFCFFHAIAP
jgi:preprotein translocase subunit Sec61beta